jgi:hypothetical protein
MKHSTCPHCRRPLSPHFLRAIVARDPEAFMPKETQEPRAPTLTLDTVDDHGKTRVLATRNASVAPRPSRP